MPDEEWLEVSNFVMKLVTENELSTDNFETVVTQLFLNYITDEELFSFLHDRIGKLRFTPIQSLIYLIVDYATHYTPDEQRINYLIAERNRLLISRAYLAAKADDESRRVHELQGFIEMAKDDEKKRLLSQFCSMQRETQDQLDALLVKQRTSVLEVLQKQALRSHYLSMFSLKTSQIMREVNIRGEVCQLSDELSNMARKTHQSYIITRNELEKSFARVLSEHEELNTELRDTAWQVAEDVLLGRTALLSSALVLLLGMAVCLFLLSRSVAL